VDIANYNEPWNKGLTKEVDSRLVLSDAQKARHREGLKRYWVCHKHLSKEHGAKIGAAHLGMHRSEEAKQRMSVSAKRRVEKHPESVRCNKISKVQRRMLDIVKSKVGSDVKVCLNHMVRTSVKLRFIDVAIPQLKLGFEFDGTYWHKDKTKDSLRDKELTDLGWTIAHINEEGLMYIAGRKKHASIRI